MHRNNFISALLYHLKDLQKMFVIFVSLFNFTLIFLMIALVVMRLGDTVARINVYVYLLHSYS